MNLYSRADSDTRTLRYFFFDIPAGKSMDAAKERLLGHLVPERDALSNWLNTALKDHLANKTVLPDPVVDAVNDKIAKYNEEIAWIESR